MALGHLPNSVAAKPARDAFVVVQRATAADLLREPWMESPCNKVTLLPLIEAVETARRQRGAPMRPVLPAYVGAYACLQSAGAPWAWAVGAECVCSSGRASVGANSAAALAKEKAGALGRTASGVRATRSRPLFRATVP